MSTATFDFKSWAGVSFSAVALLVSLYSCHTATRTAEEALAPRLAITDIQLQGTHPEDAAEEEPILRYKLANEGRSSLHDLHMAQVITTDKSKKINRENRVIETLDPGAPVDGVTYLTPGVLIPSGFTAMDMEDGKIGLTVQFETEASSDKGVFRSCERYQFNHKTQKFEHAKDCVAEVLK